VVFGDRQHCTSRRWADFFQRCVCAFYESTAEQARLCASLAATLALLASATVTALARSALAHQALLA